MKFKVLFEEDGIFAVDEFRISTQNDSKAIAKGVGELYEKFGVEVLGVVQIQEVDVSVL